ncbi:MAG: fructosamine kinase family protein [Balneolaceae bacterium]|nr:fructosamine kinase family protein [Balneolaceae bacterium]
MLPNTIKNAIQEEVEEKISDVQTLHGGDINQAAKVVVESDKKYFLKWNMDAPPRMFQVEAKGLNLLADTNTNFQIPAVILENEHFLLLSLISEGGGKKDSSFNFGKDLAILHRATHEAFGLDHDNYIGRLPQSNTPHSNWLDFFTLERIEPQIKMGVEAGTLNRTVLRAAEGMYKKLGSIFPSEDPALLHGDLWSGNFMFTKSGNASIYDPAVYYGHREMDLAMTRLFGGFSANFYEGYNEEYPLEDGFDSRVTLYNLYPILVHANLFGGSYCRQAESIIHSYS